MPKPLLMVAIGGLAASCLIVPLELAAGVVPWVSLAWATTCAVILVVAAVIHFGGSDG